MDAGGLVQRACDSPDIVSAVQLAGSVNVLAAGKAAAAMLNAFTGSFSVPFPRVMGVSPAVPAVRPEGSEWFVGGHPLPDQGSVAAATRALAIAQDAPAEGLLVVLLSGGGSALMALPAESVSLRDKQETAQAQHITNDRPEHPSRIQKDAGPRPVKTNRCRRMILLFPVALPFAFDMVAGFF